jgi:hypothetical protein
MKNHVVVLVSSLHCLNILESRRCSLLKSWSCPLILISHLPSPSHASISSKLATFISERAYKGQSSWLTGCRNTGCLESICPESSLGKRWWQGMCSQSVRMPRGIQDVAVELPWTIRGQIGKPSKRHQVLVLEQPRDVRKYPLPERVVGAPQEPPDDRVDTLPPEMEDLLVCLSPPF